MWRRVDFAVTAWAADIVHACYRRWPARKVLRQAALDSLGALLVGLWLGFVVAAILLH